MLKDIKAWERPNRPQRIYGMTQNVLEQYVSPEEAAAFLKINRLKIIRMARSGAVPAHPLGTGNRRHWRFKLSEIDKQMQDRVYRSPSRTSMKAK